MESGDAAELARFRIEFELPPAPVYDVVVVDGDLPIGRALRQGVGVTALDLDDAVALVASWLIEWNVIASVIELPPIVNVQNDVDITGRGGKPLGNPAWRGIWSPPDNLGGPTPFGSHRR